MFMAVFDLEISGCHGSRVPHAGDGTLCPARDLLCFRSHYAAQTGGD